MKSILFAAACCVLSIGFSARVFAQGVVVPIICPSRPCVPRPQNPLPASLPVKSIVLDTKINNQVAVTHVEQVFRNDSPYTLEGTYFFPIPEAASITEFAIWENGKKLVGEVRSREEARKIYDEIVRRQRDPGLLEYAGKNLFQASIFPIPPSSDKKLEITYSQILKAESGTVAYRYPLGTGGNLRANNGSVTAGKNQAFGTISGKINIAGSSAVRNIYSPTHRIETTKKGENSVVVSFETTTNDEDFQLFYGLSKADFGVSLLTYREAGKEGYFLLQVAPKDDISDREIVAKDIVFVLDTSGSMADEGKMEKARAAMLFGIGGLRTGDKFNVINFAGEEHLMEPKPISADAAGKKRAADFVKNLTPTGGTNISDALKAALNQFDSSVRPKMLVFMTDGLPTVGEKDVAKIIAETRAMKIDGLRLFTFGVGYDVNTTLLDKLAAENSGAADYIEPKEDLEIKVGNFFTKVNSPVLTGIKLDFGAVQTDLMYPRAVPDIFKGTQLVIIGRYKNASDVENAVLKLTGKSGSETKSFDYGKLDFPMRAEENSFLPRLWATRRVGWLVEEIRSNGDSKELRDEIVALGTRYGIVTPYTSFLAIDGDGNRNASPTVTAGRQSDLPVNGRNVSAQIFAGSPPPPKPAGVQAKVGRDAVISSKKAREQQMSVSVTADNESLSVNSGVKRVGTKTFYLAEGVWTDSEYDRDSKTREKQLIFASDEFFEVLKNNPELGAYFAVGEKVVVVWKGSVYRVVNK